VLTALFVSNLHTPAIPVAAQILHPMEKVDGKAFLALQGIKKIRGERTIIHVSARAHSRHRNFLGWITALHDQRDPFRNLLFVVGIFHTVIKRMSRECCEALFQKCNIGGSAHKTHVGHGMNKRLRVFDAPFFTK
jgi:hypothetical protein